MADFQRQLVQYVMDRMAGSHDLDKEIESQPSERFILGCLAPRRSERMEEDTDPLGLRDTDRASIRARQLRVSVLLRTEEVLKDRQITYRVRGYIFYRIKRTSAAKSESNEGQAMNLEQAGFLWRRAEFVTSGKTQLSGCHAGGSINIELDFSDVRDRANKDPEIADVIPDSVWKAVLAISTKPFQDGWDILHFHLTNTDTQDAPKKRPRYERVLFDCCLEVDLGGAVVGEFCDEYLYNGFKQRYFYDFRSVNCHAYWVDQDRRRRFSTRHFNVFEQPRIGPRSDLPGVDLSFATLSTERGLTELEKLRDELEKASSRYNSDISSSAVGYQPRVACRQTTWEERLQSARAFSDMTKLYMTGLKYLRTDSLAREAFLRMNQTFREYYDNKIGGEASKSSSKPSWRLFQIVFIVASLRSIVGQEDLDKVDVLHVGTGGGKSEAYFGLTVFACFYERGGGKKDGVTAIVKFPLRMLSIQQLERISSILVYAEKIRAENSDTFSGAPFSLGYYVGNDDEDFPDVYAKTKRRLYADPGMTKLIMPAPVSKILRQCPLCEASDRGSMRLVDDTAGNRVIHVCDRNSEHRFFIYFSDREIFRYRPTVIVSTVDKWAGLSLQRRARSLLGSKGTYCPKGHGFIPSGEECERDLREAYKCSEIGGSDPGPGGPILSVQDEMHLLREAFGTICSHFEGFIDQVASANTRGRTIKHIAMSATLNGIDDQIRELYNKKAVVIPGQSPEGYGSPSDFFFETAPGERRLIYGLKPNLRDNHYASLRTILHTYEFLNRAQRRLMNERSSFLAEYGFDNECAALDYLASQLIPLTYHLKKQDAEDMDRLADAVINDSLGKDAMGRVDGLVLTGDRGLDELKYTIDLIHRTVATYDISKQVSPDASYSPIYATSVVSHGVDLEELNMMVFQGIPYSTSEYIQALSRIGRRRRGIVLLWLYPNRVRDDSFFRNFQRYHDSLDHEVKPVPLNRSSKLGTLQTINSLFCAGILQHLSEIAGKPLIHKSDVAGLTADQRSTLAKLIRDSYGVPVEINVEQEVDLRIRQITRSSDKDNAFFPNVLASSGNYYYRNQTGMRGIQQQLVLEPFVKDESYIERLKRE